MLTRMTPAKDAAQAKNTIQAIETGKAKPQGELDSYQ